MKYIIILIITAAVVLSACSIEQQPEQPTLPPTGGDEEFQNVQFTVSGEQKCEGVTTQDCLVIEGGLFYDAVEGFKYEQGYTYQITVAKTPRENFPQDSGQYTFKLVEILDKYETPNTCTLTEQEAEICTLEYMPVCGENGKTYASECNACASGEVIAYEPGECTSNNFDICENAGGTWLEGPQQCEYISEAFCIEEFDGTFSACESACRHSEIPVACTKQCVPVCQVPYR